MSRRAFVIVLDACGVGALPDAADYGDEGTDTLGHLAEQVGGLCCPTLGRLGLGSIVPIRGIEPAAAPAIHGRLHALGAGKDSTAGHWELMGVVSPSSPPTYPQGLPGAIVDELAERIGRGVLGNAPFNGVEAILRFGAEHKAAGDLIVYTSSDSVLQIAAHVDVVSLDQLYSACAIAREVMTGEHAVGRVIARPFADGPDGFVRTEDRRDFALAPGSRSHLDECTDAGVEVHGVGKVSELFCGRGIAEHHPGPTNERAIEATTALMRDLDEGLVFCNLVETDQVYGHRKDALGFAGALERIDAAVGEWLGLLGDQDLLVLTADHGCDVTTPGSDHSREYVPLLAVAPGVPGRRHDGPLSDVGASVLRWLCDREAPGLPGTSFAG